MLQDSKLGVSIISSQSKRHVQPSMQRAPSKQMMESAVISSEATNIQLHPPILNPFNVNPLQQHFVKSRVLNFLQISHKNDKEKQLNGVVDVQFKMMIENISTKQKRQRMKLFVKLGHIELAVSIQEMLVALSLARESKDSSIQDIKKESKGKESTNSILEQFSLKLEGGTLSVRPPSFMSHSNYLDLSGAFIEGLPIEQLLALFSKDDVKQKDLLTLAFQSVHISKTSNQQDRLLSFSLTNLLVIVDEFQPHFLTLQQITGDISMLEPTLLPLQKLDKGATQVLNPLQPLVIHQDSERKYESPDKKGNSQFQQTVSQPTLKVSIVATSLNIVAKLTNLVDEIILIRMKELVTLIQTTLIMIDAVKCQQEEKKKRQEIESIKRDEIFDFQVYDTKKATPLAIEIEAEIINFTTIILDKEYNGLLKLRLHEAKVKFIVQGSIESVKEDRIMIGLNVSDLLLIDYSQKVPEVYNKEPSIQEEFQLQNLIDEHGFLVQCPFSEDLLTNEHRIVIYRQQYNQQQEALEVNVNVAFQIINPPFEQ
ncbi:hypothetical protein FGO68_gene13682 [Halteria grandinella]|uniref:Uncharacterized protein n=1 Tax=Halteria grandinella TaxID=5974 RepID=A0A8J8NAD3_HALGN|nr:hypothetical protein FGO68_gene13682 [Halteria grandinella]